MKQINGTLEFESPAELEEMMEMVTKYISAYPAEKDNAIIKDFYYKLELMKMTW